MDLQLVTLNMLPKQVIEVLTLLLRTSGAIGVAASLFITFLSPWGFRKKVDKFHLTCNSSRQDVGLRLRPANK